MIDHVRRHDDLFEPSAARPLDEYPLQTFKALRDTSYG